MSDSRPCALLVLDEDDRGDGLRTELERRDFITIIDEWDVRSFPEVLDYWMAQTIAVGGLLVIYLSRQHRRPPAWPQWEWQWRYQRGGRLIMFITNGPKGGLNGGSLPGSGFAHGMGRSYA